MMKPLTEVRDRLQEEFDNLPYPVQWSTFTLGRIATLEAENKALRKGITTQRDMYTSIRWEYQRLDALLTGEQPTPEDIPISDIPASP